MANEKTETKASKKAAIIEDLKAKYGDIFVASPQCDPDEFVAFKRAGRTELRAFRADRDHDAYKYVADERLCNACVVYPDKKDFEALLDKYPFFISPLGGEIMIASGGGDASAKKA